MSGQLPLVSVVTPSYNKGTFIEETILSVKNQTYPRIEHIVIDGGSTDGTLAILRRYSDSLIWISEPDNGQSNAINKGWRLAKGEILAYLNADDTYMPWAVDTAVKFLTEHRDVAMVYGDVAFINEHSEEIRHYHMGEFGLKTMLCSGKSFPQPTVFFRRDVLNKVGYLDEGLHMAMDYDLWIRIGLKFKIGYIPKLLANFRWCLGTKSMDEWYKFEYDHLYILDKLFSEAEIPEEVRALKRRAYSAAHINIGLNCYVRGQAANARGHLAKALRLHPQNVMSPWLLLCLATSYLGGNTTRTLSGWKQRFTKYLVKRAGLGAKDNSNCTNLAESLHRGDARSRNRPSDM
jgi:glycosyltransferase involved in cell wall biosynthesis